MNVHAGKPRIARSSAPAKTEPKPRTPVVLLTGFEPFASDPVNPSWDAVRLLRGARIAGHRVVALRLPVTFADALPLLRRALREHRPAMVICVGLAGGRARISLERVAINLLDARIPDNAGAQPIDAPVVADAPAAYFATLPLKAMLTAMTSAGVPAELSHTAGTFVCNQVFFGLMHVLRRSRRVRGGFIHVPYSDALAPAYPGMPHLSTEAIAAGLRIAVRAALTTDEDSAVAGGSLH